MRLAARTHGERRARTIIPPTVAQAVRLDADALRPPQRARRRVPAPGGAGIAACTSAPLAICDGPPPAARRAGRADRASGSRLVPRYRQRLARSPLDHGRPRWVEDPAFRRRVPRAPRRAAGAGRPRASCCELVARVFATPLDRRRPLWELWLVEGLAGRLASRLIFKTHHALVDGLAGVEVAQRRARPRRRARRAPRRPRRAARRAARGLLGRALRDGADRRERRSRLARARGVVRRGARRRAARARGRARRPRRGRRASSRSRAAPRR